MRILFLILITTITFSCKKNKETDFDFFEETGITEEEFYSFLINDYSKRLDSLSSKKVRILYSYAARPIKIEFENDAPTTLEPPGVDFRSIRTYKLDQNRLSGFELISADVYSKSKKPCSMTTAKNLK